MKKKMTYMEGTHFWGCWLGLVAAAAIMLFPVLLSVFFQTMPDWAGVGKGLLAVAPIFWTVGIIEMVTYIPMLGAGSSYLAFVTGNLSNLKVPCAISCIDDAGVKASSEEGEIISTISTAVSSIVTMLIIALGVALIVPLTPVLESQILTPAFANILPALFGGLGVVYISKNWKIAIVPVVLMLILFICIPPLSKLVSIMVPVGAVVAITSSRIMYKKGFLDAAPAPAAAPEVVTDETPEGVEATEEVAAEEEAIETVGTLTDEAVAADEETEEKPDKE